MNVLPEDKKKAQLLEMAIAKCTLEIAMNNLKAQETGNKDYYKEAKEWAFELRDAQVELDELFKRKEESPQRVILEGRILGGPFRG